MRVLKVHSGARYVPDMAVRAQGYPLAVKGDPILHDTIVNYGKTATYFGSGGYPDQTRACVPSGQFCPDCGTGLDCLVDYIGGGSHYWALRCPDCSRRFYFDTYRFALEGPAR